jgi:Mat/Ecp fimbriae major subunit
MFIIKPQQAAALLVSTCCLGASGMAHAEAATATSKAKIVVKSELTSLLSMNFGTIYTDGAGGDVLLDKPNDNRTCAPGLICYGAYDFATLQLSGSDATVVVTYAPTVQLTGPGDDMNVEVLFPGGQGAAISVTGGQVDVIFGARLTVNANQAEGEYSGQFSVDVDYQ